MLQESLDNYFIIVAVVVGLISIILNWFYMIESARDVYITEYEVLKKTVNLPFAFSLAMLVVLWVTTSDIDVKLLNCFRVISFGWMITVLASLIISGVAKTSVENKKSIRKTTLPSIIKVVIMVVVLWLIY